MQIAAKLRLFLDKFRRVCSTGAWSKISSRTRAAAQWQAWKAHLIFLPKLENVQDRNALVCVNYVASATSQTYNNSYLRKTVANVVRRVQMCRRNTSLKLANRQTGDQLVVRRVATSMEKNGLRENST